MIRSEYKAKECEFSVRDLLLITFGLALSLALVKSETPACFLGPLVCGATIGSWFGRFFRGRVAFFDILLGVAIGIVAIIAWLLRGSTYLVPQPWDFSG